MVRALRSRKLAESPQREADNTIERSPVKSPPPCKRRRGRKAKIEQPPKPETEASQQQLSTPSAVPETKPILDAKPELDWTALQIEVDNRYEQMRSQFRQAVSALQNKFSVEMMKLPKNIRQMSAREFFLGLGGDVRRAISSESAPIEAIKRTRGRTAATAITGGAEPASTRPATRSVTRAARATPAPTPATKSVSVCDSDAAAAATTTCIPVLSIDAPCFSTPAPPTSRRGRTLRSALKERNAPPSAPRYPRAGETVLSQNGSPLGVYGGASATVDPTAGDLARITVRLESGAVVDLAKASNNTGLSDEARREARDKLAILQATLSKMMSTLAE